MSIRKQTQHGEVLRDTIQSSFFFENEPAPSIGLESVGEILGISTATARNWIRSGHLVKNNRNGNIAFDPQHIEDVKCKLASGEFGRLQKRANKKRSRNTFIPEEYAANNEVIEALSRLISYYNEERFELKPFLLSIILKLLQAQADRPSIRKELDWWFSDNKVGIPKIEVDLPREQRDFVGLVYQSLMAEGSKAESGSYYTPSKVARSMICENVMPESVFLDPCCGTGLFLLEASEIVHQPENLWGYDIDEMAVRIARINILLKFPNHEFAPNIYHTNALFDTAPKFDVVVTNPPWGAHFDSSELDKLQNIYSTESNESFAFFIRAGLRYLKPQGNLSILVPESFLNIRTHREMRRAIANLTTVKSVSNLGRVFKNVFTPVVRLDVKNAPPKEGSSFVARADGNQHAVEQTRVANDADCIFDILSDNRERDILDHLYSIAHSTLIDNADWALGIVTGDNDRFLISEKTSNAEPILTGKDIRRFISKASSRFIQFEPENFQQMAPLGRYRAPEKLLYRFISNELIFAYDNRQTLVLNSANILIPRLAGYSVKATLAFLNSRVFQFVFQRKVKALKVLRGDLEKLPFPRISEELNSKLSDLVDTIINDIDNQTKRVCFDELDQITMDAFKLTDSQKSHVMCTTKLSPTYFPFQV